MAEHPLVGSAPGPWQRHRLSVLRLGVGFGISIVCLALLLRAVSPGEIAARLSEGNALVLVPAVALYFVGTLVRSLRWRALLRGRAVDVGLLFRTLVIGLTVNDLLPGRLGEVARVFLLARHASVPLGVSLASIIVERVLDGIALTALLALGILLAGTGGWLLQLALFSGGLFAALTAVLLWGALAPGMAGGVGHAFARLLPGRLGAISRRLIDGVLAGLAPLAHASTAGLVLMLSLLAWTVEAGMYLVIMGGFRVAGGVAASAMGTAVANLATLVPSSPGYIGTFDLALQAVLEGVFGNSRDAATGYAVVVHLALLFPVVALGLFFMWREDLSLPDLGRRPPPSPVASPSAGGG